MYRGMENLHLFYKVNINLLKHEEIALHRETIGIENTLEDLLMLILWHEFLSYIHIWKVVPIQVVVHL